MSGKRETTPSRRRRKSSGLAGWWQQHREWVAGLDRGQKLRYRLLQTLVVLSILVIGVWLGLKMWMKLPEIPDPSGGTGTTQGDGAPNFDGAELPDVAKSGRRPGVYTFLLVGQDTAGGGNTDTMLLITFDSKAKTVHGMSLPRDTMINTSRKGSGHRLNAVYNFNKGSDPDTQLVNGVIALKKEVGKLTGIVPDFYVVVQWEAVGRLVDAIGGVHFEVPFDMDYDDPTPGQDLHIHLKKGYQKLNGEQAMGLIRWRHNNDYSVQYPNGDLGRVQTQQAFLKAVAAECLKPEILLKAPSLAQIFLERVSTDLSIGNLLAFAQRAAGMDAENDVTFVTMPWTNANYPGVSMILPDVDELLEILNDGFNPYQDEIQASDLSVLYRNSDGSYGVTSGTLLDSSLSRPRSSGSSSGSSGSSSSQTPDVPATEEPVENPDGSQTTDPSGSGEVTDPGGTGENPDGSQTGDSSGGTGENPDGSQPTDPSGSGGTTDPGEGQGGGQTDPGGSSGGSQDTTDPSGSQSGGGSSSSTGGGEAVPPSQDIQGGATAQAPESESGLTVADLPSWLNPTGAEPAA